MSEAPFSPTILAALEALAKWLEAEQIPNAIIGAVGVCLVAKPRFTTDIDAVIWVDRDRWEALMKSAVDHGFSLREDDALAFATRARVLLLRHEGSGVEIDLSFGALPFERELIDRADQTDVRGTSVKVATPEDLIITKAVANRPKDIADIELIVDVRTRLDLRRIRYWVGQFAEVLETPEITENVERVLKRKAARRSSARSKKAPGNAAMKKER